MQTRLSTKGQVIIPKEIREHLGWVSGCVLQIEQRGGAVILTPENDVPETRLEDLVGCAGYSGPRRSLEEMHAAVARGARERR